MANERAQKKEKERDEEVTEGGERTKNAREE